MAIRSGAVEMEAGTVEASVGGGGGADSAPLPFSSWTIVGWGEVALGGLSLILPVDQDARALPRQIWIDFAPC